MQLHPEAPYKTVLVLQDLEFGGTQRYALKLLSHLDPEVFDLELWVLRGGEQMLPLAEVSGAPVKYLTRYSWVTPCALWKLFWKLKRNKPDILYTLTAVPNIWGRIFAAFTTKSVVISSWRARKEQQFESILWRFCDKLICNAKCTREYVIKRHGVEPKRVAYVPNGVDTDFFTPDGSCRDPQPTVVFVGRFVKAKDPITLIAAFSHLRKIIENVRLIMIGQGYLDSTIRSKISAYGLSGDVDLVPGTIDVRPFLRRSWLLVLSSVLEGVPQVMLEAMSCGLPVVATAVDGIPEVVQHGVNGLLVQPRSPEQLAKSMADLLSDDETRTSMGRRARETVVENYSIKQVIKITASTILETVKKKYSES
ncbi:MAG: glycosyltransferase [Desulfomonilaceae bacterium]